VTSTAVRSASAAVALGDHARGHRVAVTTNGRTVTFGHGRAWRDGVGLPGVDAAAASGGWVTIDVPFEMRVMDRDRSWHDERAADHAPVGHHELELAATRFDFHAAWSWRYARQTTTVRCRCPTAVCR
jgi:hypothetical protein